MGYIQSNPVATLTASFELGRARFNMTSRCNCGEIFVNGEFLVLLRDLSWFIARIQKLLAHNLEDVV